MPATVQALRGLLTRAIRYLPVAVLIGFSLQAGARAQSPAVLKLKENDKLLANGDCLFQYEIKLPVAAYTTLKRVTPNTAVLIRKLGLSDQSAAIEGQAGEWIDGESTLKITYSSRGVARISKSDAWELPLLDSIDTELVAVAEDKAVLTQAAEIPGLGVATNTIKVTLPPGAFEVKTLKSPARLSYKLPAVTASGEAKAEFDFEVKDQVMTSLAKALSNKGFAQLWTARSKLKNVGQASLRDYRVRFRIAEYAPTWSAWQGTPTVVPGQTVVDSYFPIFDMEKIGRLTGQTRAALEIQYQYKGPDGKPVDETDTKELTLLSRNQVYYSSLKPADCVDWNDRMNLVGIVVSSFVTHEDTVIQQAAGRIAKWSGGADAADSDEEAIKFMAAAYLFMGENIAYQTPPSGENETKFIQHVKYGRDVLKNRAGTCIDLAILYASLCQAVGLEPVLYDIPGHCFPAVRLPRSGRIIAVEATMIGKHSFQDAVKHAAETNMAKIRSGNLPFDEAVVAKHQKAGAIPMDLPPVGEDPLEKWGIKMPNPLPAPTPTPDRNDGGRPTPQATDSIVGTWVTKFNLNRTLVTGAAIFKENGGFEGAWVFVDDNGKRTADDVGTWSVSGNRLTINGEKRGTVIRRFELKGDALKIEVAEMGGIVTFVRKK
jgi:hypothetical protein